MQENYLLPPQPPSSDRLYMSKIQFDQGTGARYWVNYYVHDPALRIEHSFERIRIEERPIRSPRKSMFRNLIQPTQVLCQTFEIRQPVRRDIHLYDCYLYITKRKSSKSRKALIISGCTFAGLAIASAVCPAVAPFAAIHLAGTTLGVAAPWVLGATGIVSSASFSGAGYLANGGSPEDYVPPEPGEEVLASYLVEDPSQWIREGLTEEMAINEPHPCPKVR